MSEETKMTNDQRKGERNIDESRSLFSRRAVLSSGAALGATLAGTSAFAGPEGGHDHSRHAPQHPEVLRAANHCAEQARQCLSHCLVSFQEGDTSLADCARKVNETESICAALASQLAANSSYVNDLAKVCRRACDDCERECRKHEETHAECKRCADSCADLIKAIDSL